MDIVYKLTDQDGYTRRGEYNQCKWGPGVTHSGTGRGGLCGPGFIHAYLSPELAVLLNPIHANIYNPKLWVCETKIVESDRGLKVGGISLTTKNELSVPTVSIEQRVIFAVLCGRAVFGGKSDGWDKWAANYIAGKNRKDYIAAKAAAKYATKAVAKYATKAAAAYAADYDATYAAAYAATYATEAAAYTLNLVKLAKQALSMK